MLFSARRIEVSQRALIGMLVAIFFAIGLSAAAGGVALKLLFDTQGNRVTAVEDLCAHDNSNARHNIEFVQRVSPDLVPLAKRTFKLTPDCHAFALETVNPKPPK